MEGAANEAVIELLAGALDLPRRAITLISGEHGRLKRLRIVGVAVEAVRTRLGLSG